MKKFIKNIYNWFTKKDGHLDFLKHDICGTSSFILSMLIMSIIQKDIELSLVVSMFAAVFAGVGKEMYDRSKGKEPDAWDILWTIKTPVIIALTIFITIKLL